MYMIDKLKLFSSNLGTEDFKKCSDIHHNEIQGGLLKSAGNPMLEEQFDQAIEMANAEMDLTDLIHPLTAKLVCLLRLMTRKKCSFLPPSVRYQCWNSL